MNSSRRGALVVIGAGMTGLSTALTWALYQDTRKHPVIVLEKQPVVGGLVSSFRRKGYLFDTTQFVPDLSSLFDFFGIQLPMVRLPGDSIRLFLADPATRTTRCLGIPPDRGALQQKLLAMHPEQIRQIRSFFDHSSALYDEVLNLKLEPRLWDLLRIALQCPKLLETRKRTFREYVQSFGITRPDLLEVFDAFAAFSSLPAERVAAALGSSVMQSLLRGAWRPRGGFLSLPLALRRRLLDLGGEIRTKAQVERILVEDGRVAGVRLSTGEVIEARQVVTTIDPKVTMEKLVGLGLLRSLDRAYADKVETMKMSQSSLSIHLGLDEHIDLPSYGLGAAYNILTTGQGTYEWLFRAAERGESAFSDDCFQVSAVAPSLGIGGKPTLTLRVVPVALGTWAEQRALTPRDYLKRKEEVAKFFIEKVEQYLIPNLRSHIAVREIATPATFARYSGSPTGSIYGMAPYPSNFGRTRLKMRTPVRGLLQPEFSHGVFPSLLAGLQAVDRLLEGKVMNGRVYLDREVAEPTQVPLSHSRPLLAHAESSE